MTTRDNAPLGKRILGFQHFGLTVQNMDRAYAFYTDVLGGTEVMRDGDFHGEKIQNTLMLNDEIEAHEKKINPATNGVPDLRNGEQRLDVRFIQFDNMVLELLHYRENKDLWVQEQHGPRRTSTGVPRILVLYTSVFTYVMMSTSTNSSTTLKLKPRGGA